MILALGVLRDRNLPRAAIGLRQRFPVMQTLWLRPRRILCSLQYLSEHQKGQHMLQNERMKSHCSDLPLHLSSQTSQLETYI